MADSEPVPAASRGAPAPAGLALLVVMAAVWSWWAWKQGAYFEAVLLPATVVICAAAALLAVRAPWHIDLRLSPALALAFAGLAGLGVWTLISALWSPAPEIAVGDGQRILVYAIVFGLGIWLCSLLGSRIELALAPLAVAAGVAGTVTVIVLWTGDDPRRVLEDGTLDYPLAYRNANAAFFAVAFFPAVGLAAARALDWRLRALSLGAATLAVDLFLLSQSRASIPAILVALIVYALLSPLRVRALCWLALAVIPALGVIPALTELYQAANDDGARSVVSELRATGITAAATAAVAVLVGAIAARFEARIPGLGSGGPRGNRLVALAIAGAVAVAAIGFVVAVGNPVGWVGDRVDEFRAGGTPDVSQESSRFTFNAASDRYDLWRVAIDDLGQNPVGGEGSGGYEYSYARNREVADQEARDAHGVLFEIAAELGVVGLLLFAAAVLGSVAGIVRARRLGPTEAGLGAIALASATYWLLHSSIDWFWPYPAITAPVLALLGSACAPAVIARGASLTRAWRAWMAAVLALLAISAIPPFISDRYVDQAFDVWREDLGRAYDDLARAESLNRLSPAPLLAEGAIAREAGDRERAIAAFGAATERNPEGWAAHYLLAELQAQSDPETARKQIGIALELNPLDRSVRRLARSLGVETAPSASQR